MTGRGNSPKNKSLRRITRACIEQLDVRQMLSVSVVNNILTVSDQDVTHAEKIVVDVDPNNNEYRVTITNLVDNSVVVNEFAQTGINSVNILSPQFSAGNFIEVDATFPNPGGTSNGITGGDGNDTIYGSPGADVIFGDYDSTVAGGEGNDLIYGRGGDDNISGGPGDDTIYGGAGNDTVGGDDGNDVVRGGAGNDEILGGDGNDSLYGAGGEDSIYGQNGSDILFGGGGDDYLFGGKGPDTLVGGGGNNNLTGGNGHDLLAGNSENYLTVPGTTLGANTGLDTLAGGPGADTLLAASGQDEVTGGLGPNEFFTVAGDSLTDFNAGQGDYFPSQNVVTGTPATTTHITLQIFVNGTAVPIPASAGAVSGANSVAQVTSLNGNTATVTFASSASGASFTLGQFFGQWGIGFSANGIGDFAGNQNMTFTVNGIANISYDGYVVHNGDAIVISYVTPS